LSTVLFSFDGLRLWLGADFAAHSFRVLQWIAIGVLVNCVAQVPFSAIQGIGRPDITAKLHLLELPLYVALLWVLLRRWGIEGAALAWTLRVTVDGLALTVISLRLLPGGKAETRRLVAQLVAVASVCMTGLIPATFDTKILILIATSMVCVLMIFTWLLKKHDLALVRQVLRTYFAG
jgi:O-antigen/teichoic acid export membrane protein